MHGLILHVSSNKSTSTVILFYTARLFISKFGTSCFSRYPKIEHKGLDKALKVLDIIVPRIDKVRGDECHHRLIQGCMQGLLEFGKENCSELGRKATISTLNELTHVIPGNIPDDDISACWRARASRSGEDDLRLFLEWHKRGISPDATFLSSILSSCGITGSVGTGVQLHALMVKVGFDKCIPTGSSLISLYSKFGQLNNAYRVFEMMPVKNTVSWTALIAGYAQHCQIETCLYLFILMIRSMLKPNDFTFASLLSACTSTASLGLGRCVQCLEIRMGFDSYVHVSNALISLYAKCGSVDEARYIFEKMLHKDLITWNSIIFGYAQYGLGEQALDLMKDMDKNGIKPDAISFLGILSSCRHAGLVDQGRNCFKMMLERGIKPELDHYSCIIDLLGRAGLLTEALELIERMPIPANAVIWGSLLSSCRVHGNIWVGIQAAESRLLLEPSCAATHVQLANLYASMGCWDRVAEIRKLMKERQLKTSPGYSWVEIANKVCRFTAQDRSNTLVKEILPILDCLANHMKCSKSSEADEREAAENKSRAQLD